MLSAPSSPNMLIYAAMAVVGGLGVGVLLVVLLQLLERGLETSDAIENALGLATLASIPDARTLPGYRKSGLPRAAPAADNTSNTPSPAQWCRLNNARKNEPMSKIGRASCRERVCQYV